jgi:type IV fimbrial biogenesis protein FimT
MQQALRRRGFSLIELMIAISIFALLIMLAGPMYADFMGNSQIRNASESLLSGIRLAQAEAIRRNTQVAFVLDTSTGWQVSGPDLDGNAETIQTYSFKEGATRTKVTATGGSTLTYDGLGRILNPNPDASQPIDHIDVTGNGMTSPRNLRIVVGLIGGNVSGVKLCDPAAASGEPQACP